MASLYTRPNSPFWFLKRKLPGGKWVGASTGLRAESEVETAKAEILRAEASLSETLEGGSTESKKDKGWGWVEGWLRLHCKTAATLESYLCSWRHISHWLTLENLNHPSRIKFAHGQEFISWRMGRKSRHRVCGKNNALKDVKAFKMVLTQAARMGMIPANPIGRIGITKDKPRRKTEITDAQFKRCLELLEIEPEWMQLSFHIAMHTGCRLKDTALPLENIDFERNTITFGKPKGGEERAFTRPLPPALVPILKPLRKRRVTHEVPAHASRSFSRFFKRAGADGVTFHCLRVSYVTRLHRAGVPLSAAMRLVNHSSDVVHEVYNRLGVDDVMPYRDVELFASTSVRSPASSKAARPSGKSRPQPIAQQSCKTRTGLRKAP
jgi:integrase